MTADAITGVGAFLRKTKIDELPQVWNILRGELSLVGPRPGLPVQTKLTDERQAHGVFSVLPGITGLAQINGVDMSDPERLARMDAHYIAQRGLLLDLKIILATFLGRGQGDKVRA
jgi:lipopolysaccharide/colanic/teichoic acid biosynthesis glycosyltransferase